MNSPTTSRRQAQPITIGPRHGYQIDGDHVIINAELQVPPHHSGGEWTLELWATEEPYRSGPMTGIRIAPLALDLPTPIGPYVHQVDTRAAAHLPPQGRAYSMVLALVQQGQDDALAAVHAFANYPERQTFQAPGFTGTVGYDVQGDEVALQAYGIRNPRARDNLSGTLSLELWAFPASGPATDGVRLAAAELGRVAGQGDLEAVERRVAFSEPPVGRFQISLLLREWTFAHGYVTRDRRDFGTLYEQMAPNLPVAPVRPVERLRLVTKSEPEDEGAAKVAPPIAGARTGAEVLVSIQTGSVEELAVVKGLNLKLAKEIIKARPFLSVAELVRVRGIGPKTVTRLKQLVKV